MSLVAGIDSSTQSCTVLLRDADDGAIVAAASAPHPSTTPPVSEQEPASWWTALHEAFAATGATRVRALSVGAQAHGLVPLDAAGQVIRPAKLWNDTTSAPEARELVERLGAGTWARTVGSVPVSAFTITKLLWLARHEPESFTRLATVLLPHDWLTYQLTGRAVADRGGASGTGYFSPSLGAWQPQVLELIAEDVDWPARLPALRGPNEAAGPLTTAAAESLGVVEQAIVGPGTGDNMAAALGLGVGSGDVVFSLGTSGCVYATHPLPTMDPTGAICGNADAAGAFLPLVCTLNATKVTDAFARLLGVSHAELATMALAAPETDDRPVLAAYLDGERVPDRPGATGLLAGIRSDVTREELARAAYEGVLAGLVAGMDALNRAGIDTSGRLILTGGGARSAAYRQFAADLTGRAVHVVPLDETVASGAAVQAAAVLHGVPVSDVMKSWSPSSQLAAEPRVGSNPEPYLARYRALAEWDVLDTAPSAAPGPEPNLH